MYELVMLVGFSFVCVCTYLLSYIFKGFSILLLIGIISALVIYKVNIVLICILIVTLLFVRVNNKKVDLDIEYI